MQLLHGDGTCQKTTSVGFVEYNSTELARLANIQAMTVLYVSGPSTLDMISIVLNSVLSNREVRPLFPYGMKPLKITIRIQVLILRSIVCSHGFSKILPRAYVPCAGRVRYSFLPWKPVLTVFTRIRMEAEW